MNSGRATPVRIPDPTPDEVRTATFNQSQLAWRGFSEDEVREFLTRVADSMAAADKERLALRAEIDRLRNFYREHGADVDRVGGGPRHPRRTGDEDSLVRRVEQYTDVQLEWAKQYATLVDDRADEQADEVFHHAKVQAALAMEQAIRIVVDGTDAFSRTTGAELRRASEWLSAFAHALHAQLEVVNDAFNLEISGRGRRRSAS
jgi:DivIVA domain-containing protein